MKLKWKQVGNDYELRCPCCRAVIAMIYKREGLFEGLIDLDNKWRSEKAKSFIILRQLINKRVEELLAE